MLARLQEPKAAVTTLQDYLDFDVIPAGYKRGEPDPIDADEATRARCSRCGAVGLQCHAYHRREPWGGYIVLWECRACKSCEEV